MNSPQAFDEEKYKKLLGGLECSEVMLSNLNEDFRIDSDFYKQEYFDIYEKLVTDEYLGDICEMHDVTSNGSFEYVKQALNSGENNNIPYIRSGNVGSTFINKQELEHISEEAHNKLPLSHVKLYDVMMARKGKIGGASIITENEVDYNCNENVVRLTIKDIRKYKALHG